MERQRSRYETLPECKYITWGVAMPGAPTGRQVMSTEAFTDSVWPKPLPKPLPCNAIYHTKVEASLVEGSNSASVFGYPYGQPTQITFPTEIKQSVMISEHIVDQGVIDWSTLTVSLADQVHGLLQSKSQLAVTFAEFHKTWKMVRNPFSLLKSGWRPHVGKLSASQLAKKGANLWLEGQYGWKPLFGDLKNLADSAGHWSMVYDQAALDKRSQRFGNRAVYAGTPIPPSVSDSDWEARKATFRSQAPWATGYQWPWNKRVVYDTPSIHACVSCWADGAFVTHASQLRRSLSQFGADPLRDLLPSLWELVPFSFVVDWFVNSQGLMNMARYNAALGTLNQAGVHSLCHSTQVVYTGQAQIIPYVAQAFYDAMWWWVGKEVRVAFTNGCLTGTKGKFASYNRVLGPPPNTSSVFAYRGLTLTQLANSLSLFVQRLR